MPGCCFIKLLQRCHSQLVDKLLNCRTITSCCNKSVGLTGLKISFTGPSDKMSDDVEFAGSDLQFSFDSEISLNDTNEYQHNVLILNGKCCEDIK